MNKHDCLVDKNILHKFHHIVVWNQQVDYHPPLRAHILNTIVSNNLLGLYHPQTLFWP